MTALWAAAAGETFAISGFQEGGGRESIKYGEMERPRGLPHSAASLLDLAERSEVQKIPVCTVFPRRVCARPMNVEACGSSSERASKTEEMYRVNIGEGERELTSPPVDIG